MIRGPRAQAMSRWSSKKPTDDETGGRDVGAEVVEVQFSCGDTICNMLDHGILGNRIGSLQREGQEEIRTSLNKFWTD